MDSDATMPAELPEDIRYGSFVIVRDLAGLPRLLGEGTFGKTYLARHQYLNTLAALKVITERFATQHSARERFLSEGRALVRLDHRHIARLHDFGEASGALFYAMEYCAGGDLAERVKKSGALPLADWLEVAQQLAQALECCHGAGFIHRDIKPSNIMLARSEGPLVAKLIDFGLVQAELTDPTGDSNLVGTPLYASPEQLREEPIDQRSDLFSLGMTLWHLALGTSPESGNSAKIIGSRLSMEGYAELLPRHLPEPLRALLARLVEKDRSRRTASAAEFSRQLAEAARAAGLPAPHVGSAPAFPASADTPRALHAAGSAPFTGVTAGLRSPGSSQPEMPEVKTNPPPTATAAATASPALTALARRAARQVHASAIATPPPLAPAPTPARGRAIPRSAAIAILIGLVGAGLLFVWKSGPRDETATPPSAGILPENATVALVGDFPAQCTVTVDGVTVQPRQVSGLWQVPLGGKTLPVEVRVSAPGFRVAVSSIASRDQLKAAQSLSFERSKGTLVFIRPAATDYSRASVRMEEALPAEDGLVPLERVTRSKGMMSPEERLELPTGKWLVTLEGSNGRVVRPRVFQRVEIEDQRERKCLLPMSFAGAFKGDLRDRDGAASTELVIEPGLTDGTLSDTRGGIARRARLEGCRVDGSGAFSALVKFSHSPTAPGYDEQITATLAGEAGDLTVKIFEVLTDEESVKKQMNRAPFSENEWSRTGTLSRSR